MKTCIKCNLEKSEKNFNTGRNQCKPCRLEYKQSLPKKNHPISVIEKSCTSCKVIKPSEQFHPDGAFKSGLYPYCRPCALEKQKAKYQRQREKYNKKSAERYERVKGTEIINASVRARQKKRMQTDPKYVLTRRLRNRLWYALKCKSWKKGSKLSEYLGCDLETLRTYIEARFLPNMAWENQCEWHLDHIIPLDSAETEVELYKLCHYTNIQPLWGRDNIVKGTKL